ncbi:MAG: hypothetical protein K0U93_30060, partial [Gammaproteobacteria bacterium]|nr:hypothetical protein [Gammaproteobacteria bacterium]
MANSSASKKSWSPGQMFGSAVAAIVLWSALGFSWFGFGFGWNTAGTTAQASAVAVMDELATICVAQAKSAPDSAPGIAGLADLSTWKQRKFVEEAGWANMHGKESSTSG